MSFLALIPNDWTYDGTGNRLTEGSNSYSYTQNTNKLASANGKVFGYDNNGNTTTENAKQFTYNQNQRLIQVVDGTMTAGYTYNGNGQRVKKSVNGTTTIFHYSQNGQLIAESNSAGTITAEYVYLNGQPLAKIEGADTYYYHNDHLGTPQKLTDNTGAIVWNADYKPFGEATITGTVTNNLRFPGQYFDAETGNHYNYFRDYNPQVGRYVQSDPIGFEGGDINLYGYVGNSPLNRTDPTGLKWVWFCKARLGSGGSARNTVAVVYPFFGHCYIKFGDDARGFYAGATEGNWVAMQEEERTPIINRWCRPSWVSDCVYDCLKKNTSVGTLGAPYGGSSFSNNCCTNLDTKVKECTEKCCGK